MAISLKEATSTLKKLNTKVQKGDVAGGNDILAEMKVSYKQKKAAFFFAQNQQRISFISINSSLSFLYIPSL